MKRTVTAVIPNYNYARFLPGRVESILNQTYPISELVILDDCSSDDSEKVIRQILEHTKITHPDLKINFFQNKLNSGSVFEQWAKAFEKVSSDYLWICEADDLCDRNFLDACMKGFDKNPKVLISYTDSKMIDDSGNTLMKSLRSWSGYDGYDHWKQSYINHGQDELKNYLAINNTIINVSGVVFKRQKNVDYAGFLKSAASLKLAGDWYFYAKILQFGDIAYCAEPHNFYRLHSGSVSDKTDNMTHYREITFVQDEIARNIELPEKTKSLINHRRVDLISKWDLENKTSDFFAPLVSVIVPAYNIEHFLPNCLDSILSGTYDNYEIIVVDDGSSDETGKICNQYEKRFSKIRIIHQENAGLSVARNTGIKAAKGKYLAFIDGDDLVSPNFLLDLANIAELIPADIVECGYLEFSNNPPKSSGGQDLLVKTRREATADLLVGQENLDIVTWNKLYDRELFKEIKFPANELHEDNLTTYKLFAAAVRIAVIDKELYYYRKRGGSIMAEQNLLARLK